MIHITQGEENELIVTGTEKVTINDPFFLFRFIHTTGAENVFILSNQSAHTARYDQFTFTEGEDDAKTFLPGSYKYEIYAQQSGSNLIPGDADELVESGLADVKAPSVNEPAENVISQIPGQNIIE